MQIFKEILKILQTLHQQLRMSPESIESVSVQALALMFMLRQFLSVSPTSDISWLQKACEIVSGFRSWPLPYSHFANELLSMIENEMKAPGTELRAQLMMEAPELLPTAHAQRLHEHGVLQVHVLVDREDPLSNTHQALFDTVQSETGRRSSGGGLMMLREGHDEREEEGGDADSSEDPKVLDLSPARLRIRMVTHIISCDFCLPGTRETDGGLPTDDPLNLGEKSEEEMLAIYEKALDIHEQAKEFPVTDPTIHSTESGVVGGICKLFREKLVGDLLQEISPGHTHPLSRSKVVSASTDRRSVNRSSMSVSSPLVRDASGSTSLSSPSNLATVRSSSAKTWPGSGSSGSMSRNCGASGGKVGVSSPLAAAAEEGAGDEEPEEEPAPFRPFMPPPEPTVGVAELPTFANSFTPLIPPVQFKFWQFKTAPISKPSATQKTGNGYLFYKKECEQLVNLVNATLEKAPPNFKPTLKLVLMGSNLILHKFLCAYAATYEVNAALLNSVDMRIYICPEGQNDMGRFLAWTDKWYQRHVFAPFATGVPLAPQFSGRETFPASLLEEYDMHSTLPVNLLREMLQHYVRTADHTEKIKVFDMQVWTENDVALRRMSLAGHKMDSFMDELLFESGLDSNMDLLGSSNNGGGGGANNDGSAPALSSPKSSPTKEKKKKKAGEEEVVEEEMPVFGITPNVRVPFITSMEIGILSRVEAYKFNMMKQSESLTDILGDKAFMETLGGSDFPTVQISYRTSNLNQKASEETKVINGEFLSISVSNIPEGIRGFETSVIGDEEKFGTWSGLTMSVRRNKGKLKETLDKKTKLTAVEIEKFINLMKSQDSFGIQNENEDADQYDAKTLLVGTISVQVTRPRDSFYILVDGALVGPVKKITVGPSGLKHAAGEKGAWEIPIQSFFPVAAFKSGEESE